MPYDYCQQCEEIWPNFNNVEKILDCLFRVWQHFKLLWQLFMLLRKY